MRPNYSKPQNQSSPYNYKKLNFHKKLNTNGENHKTDNFRFGGAAALSPGRRPDFPGSPGRRPDLSMASEASLLAVGKSGQAISFKANGADARGSGPVCPSGERSFSPLQKLYAAPFKNVQIRSRSDLYAIRDRFQSVMFSPVKKKEKKYKPRKPYWTISACPSMHNPKIVELCSCNDWTQCYVCRKKRMKKNQKKISDYLLAANIDKPKHHSLKFITLTLKKNEMSFGEARSKLLKSFQKLKRRKIWNKKISFYCATMEVVESNVHLHIACTAGFWEQSEISNLWLDITGDSFVVDIRKISSIEDATKELSKYMVKDSKTDVLEELIKYREAHKKMRYLFSGRRPPSLDTIAISGQPKCEKCGHCVGHIGEFSSKLAAQAFLIEHQKQKIRPTQLVEPKIIVE